ncbi:MAG: succinylarginine dihydrolase, partial [Alphaproteobacteria bacterium HGW-Alphaproteobacteria-13]
DEAKLDRIAAVIEAYWPQAIASGDLASPALLRDVRRARAALLEALGLSELL